MTPQHYEQLKPQQQRPRAPASPSTAGVGPTACSWGGDDEDGDEGMDQERSAEFLTQKQHQEKLLASRLREIEQLRLAELRRHEETVAKLKQKEDVKRRLVVEKHASEVQQPTSHA